MQRKGVSDSCPGFGDENSPGWILKWGCLAISLLQKEPAAGPLTPAQHHL
jgi:hypothetical protein